MFSESPSDLSVPISPVAATLDFIRVVLESPMGKGYEGTMWRILENEFEDRLAHETP